LSVGTAEGKEVVAVKDWLLANFSGILYSCFSLN